MQSIRTRYIGPSNSKSSRIQAKCEAGTIYMSYRHELNLDDNHLAACLELRKKLGWIAKQGKAYECTYGGSFDGDMYWVFPCEWLTAIA